MNALALLAAAAAGGPSIEPVVVTATRTETPLNQVISSVEVIPGDALLRQPASDLGDALRSVPGVEVARLGGHGQQTSMFLRGTDSNHVLVLVDGLRINPGTIGSAAIQNIAPELVDRVEIVKGPRSTLWGSDAIGGVIHVITRVPADGGGVQAGYGRFDTRNASLAAGIAGEQGGASFGASWIESDGFPVRSGDTTDRGYENLSFAANGRLAAGPAELSLHAWHASGTSEYSDFFLLPVDQDFENSAFSIAADLGSADTWRSRVAAGQVVDEIVQNQSPDFVETRRVILDWQNDVALSERQTLTAGVLWQDQDADATSFGLDYDAQTERRQLYVQDQLRTGAHRMLLGVSWTDHETFGSHVTWNAEYGHDFGDGALVTVGAGTGFRAPDATDLFGFGGNPDLEPEESTSYEVAWRQRIGDRQSVSLAAFRNEIDELIEFVVTDPATFEGENRNVERARIEGVEAGWRYEGALWSARASATLQNPRDLTADERLLRRARENLALAVLRRVGDHEIGVDLLYAGERRDFGFPTRTRLPSYWLANLSTKLALGPRWTLLARAENLFDEDYELASGFNTMGRSLFVALRHEFR